MYVKRILPNGVRLITERIDNMRTVSVGIWVGNGSRYEPAELGGVSHFIEHMIFKGTEKRSARHIAIAIDALGGQANAFTDKECTCYYMKVLDSRLKNAVALLADMFLHSRFAQEDLELERGVVLEEIDMYEDSPEDVAIDKLFESCYSGSALGRPILGTAETLEPMTSETLHKYMREYYRPQDTVVAVSGHFTDEDLDFIEELFSEMQGEGENVITPAAYQPSLLLSDQGDRAEPPVPVLPGRIACQRGSLCNEPAQSPFSAAACRPACSRACASRTVCATRCTRLPHRIWIPVCCPSTPVWDRKTERKALDLILRELDEFCQNGPAPDELSRCREQAKTTLLMGLENTGNRMMTIGRSELLRGEVSKIEEVLDSYDRVTADDILNLARRVFDRSKASLAVVGQPDSEDTYRELLR